MVRMNQRARAKKVLALSLRKPSVIEKSLVEMCLFRSEQLVLLLPLSLFILIYDFFLYNCIVIVHVFIIRFNFLPHYD